MFAQQEFKFKQFVSKMLLVRLQYFKITFLYHIISEQGYVLV